MEEEKIKTRDEALEYWQKEFQDNLKRDAADSFKHALDCAYAEGYNKVLQAAEEVFGLTENYWKIVKKLEELGF